MIEIVGLSKSWGAQPVLRGVNLTIAPGEHVVLSGPSGGGKTTLLRIIAGLEMPDEGQITINGRTVTGDGPPVPPCDRHLGVVFQQYALWPNMTVRGNIAFACRRGNAAEKSALINKMAELCGVGDLLNRSPATLSGGQARRVALARAFASSPRYLLLDEPTSNLDDASRAALNEAVRAFAGEERSGVLFISHVKADIDEMAGTHLTLTEGHLQQL
jgi:iron(III) transport system ATP-binding protein